MAGNSLQTGQQPRLSLLCLPTRIGLDSQASQGGPVAGQLSSTGFVFPYPLPRPFTIKIPATLLGLPAAQGQQPLLWAHYPAQ